MNQPKQVKSSSIFLLELILAILFFSVASAVCVQIFVKAHLLSQSAQTLNFAVNECSGVAEVLSTTDSLEEVSSLLCILYPKAETTSLSNYNLYYDDAFLPCEKADAKYQLSISLEDLASSIDAKASSYSTFQAHLCFEDVSSFEQVYTLGVTHHISQEVMR